MSKFKILKEPKAPRLPKKPAQNSTLKAKQNWIKKVELLRQKHTEKVRAIKRENEQRKKLNTESLRLNKVIAGIDKIEIRPSAFSVKKIRPSHKVIKKKKHIVRKKRVSKKK